MGMQSRQLTPVEEPLAAASPNIGPQFQGLSPNLNLPAEMCSRFD